MLLVLITLTLIAIGIGSFIVGAWMISRYAFRVSSGKGVGVLLFPPYTFWFAFFELEQEGKEIPIATWLFGIVSTVILLLFFWQPVNTVFSKGFTEAAAQYSGVGEAAVEEYGAEATGGEKVEETEEPKEEAPAETEEEAAPAEEAPAEEAGAEGAAVEGEGSTPAEGAAN